MLVGRSAGDSDISPMVYSQHIINQQALTIRSPLYAEVSGTMDQSVSVTDVYIHGWNIYWEQAIFISGDRSLFCQLSSLCWLQRLLVNVIAEDCCSALALTKNPFRPFNTLSELSAASRMKSWVSHLGLLSTICRCQWSAWLTDPGFITKKKKKNDHWTKRGTLVT